MFYIPKLKLIRLSTRNTDRISRREPLRSCSPHQRSDLRRKSAEIDLRNLGNRRERAGFVVDDEESLPRLLFHSEKRIRIRLRPKNRPEKLVDRSRKLRRLLHRNHLRRRRRRGQLRGKDSAIREVRHGEASRRYGRVELAFEGIELEGVVERASTVPDESRFRLLIRLLIFSDVLFRFLHFTMCLAREKSRSRRRERKF